MKSPRLLVRASAGTGKTHRLTSRYLELLLGGVDADRILATTFTRKAAHEILERVLSRLARAARGGRELELLRASVGRDVSADECLELLARLLRGLDRVRIGTIDAYLAQLARLCALDLGLPPTWRIGDPSELDLLRSEAVADAVAEADAEELLGLLRDFQRQAVGQGAHDELLRFVGKGREALLDSRADAWEGVRPAPDVEPAKLDGALEALRRLALPKTKTGANAGTEKKHWATSRRKILDAAAAGDWFGLLEKNGLVEAVLEGRNEYDRSPILPDQVEILRPILDRALHVVLERLAIQNRASRRLLERFEASYRELARAQGLLGFEDLPAALAPIGDGDPLAARGVDAAHRLDGRVEHLLLDEFQDTSPVQWRVLRPLVERAGSCFLVGDEKQSIYGWRSAEPRLLREFDSNRKDLEVERLLESYRSSTAVLGTVNLVVASLAGSAADAEAAEAAREFARGFESHTSARSKGEEPPGAAFLLRAPAPAEDEDDHDPALSLAVTRVQEILSDAPLATVGILLRRRAWIPDLIHRLRVAGISASDEGGNPLTDSAAVLHALSLLHLADHPADLAAAFHVASSPVGKRVGLDADAFRARASEVARGVRAALAQRGYGAYLASIRPTEGEGYGAWDVERFGQLVDLGYAWEGKAGSRARAFVEHVRGTKVEDPSAARVRVMTVHAAKGLEFDAVVLPELDTVPRGSDRPLWTRRPDAEGSLDLVSHTVSRTTAAAHPVLAGLRADADRRRKLEDLCVLYVAMTRAKHRLDLIVRAREKEGGGSSFAATLRAALGVPAAGPSGVAWEHPKGTKPWFPSTLAGEIPGGRAETGARRLRLAPSRRPRSLSGSSPSRAKDLGPARAARLLRPIEAITARGRILHRLLEEVEWIENFDRSDEELLAIARRIEPDERAVRSALDAFRALLARPEMRRELSNPEDGARVRREMRFALVMPGPDGKEALWSGAFDRVVLRETSAEILDFKTDRVVDADIYRPQMQIYRRALARIAKLDEASIATTLLFVGGDSVARVSLEPAAGAPGSGSRGS